MVKKSFYISQYDIVILFRSYIYMHLYIYIDNIEYQVNRSPPGQNSRYFTDDIFRCIFVNEKFCIYNISFMFVPKGPIDNNSVLVYIMAWRRVGASDYLNHCLPDSVTHIYATLGGDQLISNEGNYWVEISSWLKWSLVEYSSIIDLVNKSIPCIQNRNLWLRWGKL